MKLWSRGFSGIVAVALWLTAAPSGWTVINTGYQQQTPQPKIIPGVVAVRFEDGLNLNASFNKSGAVSFAIGSVDAILNRFEVQEAAPIFPDWSSPPPISSGMDDLSRFYELRFSEDIDVNLVVAELMNDPNVRVAEPVWAIPLEATPNDPFFSNSFAWAMAPPGPDPNFYTAWDTETGSDSIKIAIIDSGTNYRHRDLEWNIWVNPGEDIDGDGEVYDPDDINFIDDDGNGRTDDLVGYDFFTGFGSGLGIWPGEDGGSVDNDPNDFEGHGTHVAGITAAVNNNATDVMGAAGGWFGSYWRRGARIMVLRVGGLADDGLGYVNSSNCATAINYAVQNGAHVINCSWGGSTPSASAANNAIAAGLTVCHAAGNDNVDSPDDLDAVPGVLSVASTGATFGNSDAKSGFSNYGSWVDVSAPGSQIRSTFSDEYVAGVAVLGGTSMASPMVAGLAALIRSAMPSLSGAQVDSIINATADSAALYAANPAYAAPFLRLGTGRIDATAALADLPVATFTADVNQGMAPLTVQFTDLSPNSPTAWDWDFGTGAGSTDQNPQYTYSNPGIYDVSLAIDDGNPLGLGQEQLKRFIWVYADTLEMGVDTATPGSTATVPVRLTNTAPVYSIELVFKVPVGSGISYDTALVDGLRTDYFEEVGLVTQDEFSKTYILRMTAASDYGITYLAAGSGPVVNLVFAIDDTTSSQQTFSVDTTNFFGTSSSITTLYGEFWPISFNGSIYTQCRHGDANCDNSIDVGDIIFLVEYSFNNGPAPDPRGGDANGSGEIDVSDIIYLVEYSFNNGPPPPVD